MNKKSKKSKKYWVKHIKCWEQSGLTQIEYCQKNKIPISSFTNKKSKLARTKKDNSPFVELEIPAIDFESANKIEIRLPSNIKLLIEEDIDPLKLREIVLAFGDM